MCTKNFENFYAEQVEKAECAAGQDFETFGAGYAAACNNLAEYYEGQGDFESAETYYNKTLTIRARLAGMNPEYYGIGYIKTYAKVMDFRGRCRAA